MQPVTSKLLILVSTPFPMCRSSLGDISSMFCRLEATFGGGRGCGFRGCNSALYLDFSHLIQGCLFPATVRDTVHEMKVDGVFHILESFSSFSSSPWKAMGEQKEVWVLNYTWCQPCLLGTLSCCPSSLPRMPGGF